MKQTLILRFSAIGDVAMTVPVVDSVARRYPELRYIMVSQSRLEPLFAGCPDNVRFVGVDLKHDYKGIRGLFRLFRQLRQHRIGAVADLHDVLRSKILRILFLCCGVTVRHIHKGRADKRRLTAWRKKDFRQLTPSIDRYREVFAALGQPVDITFRSIYASRKPDFSGIDMFIGAKNGLWIGIAPFARHGGKIYPTERTERVVAHFAARSDTTLFLFGGGASEQSMMQQWSDKYPHTISVAGKLKMTDELELMSRLNLMFSMDSANMHLASLVATPVISFWGATHPYAGFYGYRQSPESAIQADLPCRPCSVFGNKPCSRGDYACLTAISPEEIIERMESVL